MNTTKKNVFKCNETEDLSGVCELCKQGIDRHGPDYECLTASHTAGEWKVDDNGTKLKVIDLHGQQICVIAFDQPSQENKANARLIASAPLMLKALEAALNMGDDYEAEKLVREAIKQARGEA